MCPNEAEAQHEVLNSSKNEDIHQQKLYCSAGSALSGAALLVSSGCTRKYVAAVEALFSANNLPSPDFSLLFSPNFPPKGIESNQCTCHRNEEHPLAYEEPIIEIVLEDLPPKPKTPRGKGKTPMNRKSSIRRRTASARQRVSSALKRAVTSPNILDRVTSAPSPKPSLTAQRMNQPNFGWCNHASSTDCSSLHHRTHHHSSVQNLSGSPSKNTCVKSPEPGHCSHGCESPQTDAASTSRLMKSLTLSGRSHHSSKSASPRSESSGSFRMDTPDHLRSKIPSISAHNESDDRIDIPELLFEPLSASTPFSEYPPAAGSDVIPPTRSPSSPSSRVVMRRSGIRAPSTPVSDRRKSIGPIYHSTFGK